MSTPDLVDYVKSASAQKALDHLATFPQNMRRKQAAAMIALYKEVDRFRFGESGSSQTTVQDIDAVTVGVLATATFSQLKSFSFLHFPQKIPLEEIVQKLRPDWTQKLVDHLVEDSPYQIGRLAPLWKAGHCRRPEGDAIILGYYVYGAFRTAAIDEEELLAGDVWRFFEVEGGGEFSLANHDKFLKKGQESWADRLIRYSEDGRLDRGRLLDASLDALERDFGQYVAGWYSRFHVALKPSLEETSARAGRYLGLLGSAVPPTVSFALKHVQALDKAGVLDPAVLLDALEPALQARAKGTVLAALKLTSSAAKRDRTLHGTAARAAAAGLVSEDAGVQQKVLDLIEALAGAEDTALRATLAEYRDLVKPSVRPRLSALAGIGDIAEASEDVGVERMEAEPLRPVQTAQDALALFLSVLEDPRDPFDVERAIDGVSRFGAELRADERALSPLQKRAAQVWRNPGHTVIRAVLALTGLGLTEGRDLAEMKRALGAEELERLAGRHEFQSVHIKRNFELVEAVLSGRALPMLSLPSDTSGCVAPADLVRRLNTLREAGVEPGDADLSLALMRLSHEGRETALADMAVGGEAERALRYAFGRDEKVGPTPGIWASAWSARGTPDDDAALIKVMKARLPGAGIPPRTVLEVSRTENGEYHWVDVDVPVKPALTKPVDILPAMYFYQPRTGYYGGRSCGHTFADIAWASIVCPGRPEAFFRQGILHVDLWEKLSDNYARAYLEPFFRPGPEFGPLGAAILVQYMASEDKSVSSLAVDATVEAVATGRMSDAQFASAFRTFLLSNALPTARWTKALLAVSEAGQADFARLVIERVLDFAPDDAPRDLGGLLELLYELSFAAGVPLCRAEAVDCLSKLPGGGKVAKFRKLILALADETGDPVAARA